MDNLITALQALQNGLSFDTSRETTFEQLVDFYPWLTFWYGLPPSELSILPNEIKFRYVKELPEIIKLYQSTLISASIYPHTDDSGRRSINAMFGGKKNEPPARRRMLPPPKPESDDYVPSITREQYLQRLTNASVQIIEVGQSTKPGPPWPLPPGEVMQ